MSLRAVCELGLLDSKSSMMRSEPLTSPCRRIRILRADPDLSLNLQKLILAAQADAEEEALARGSWFISDRSGLDPIVYAREYAGAEAAAHMVQSDDWLMVKKRMSRSIVVVCEAGMGWLKDDGVRLMPRDREDWIAFHELFCGMLDKAGLLYHILPVTMTDLSERVNFVLSKWQHRMRCRCHDILFQSLLEESESSHDAEDNRDLWTSNIRRVFV